MDCRWRRYRWRYTPFRQQGLSGRAVARAAAGVEADGRAVRADARAVDGQPASSGLEGQLGPGLQDDLEAALQMDFRTGLAQPLAVHLSMAVRMHGAVVVGKQLGFALLFERFVGFALGQDVGEVVHGAVPVVQDVLFPVVLDVGVHVLFRMHVDFFPAFFVLHPKFVEAARLAFGSRRAHGFEHRARLVRGQLVGRHVQLMVDAARDQGAVRVAFQERDHDLVADARDSHDAVFAARPFLRSADPAGGLFIVLAFAVPVKLHLHAAVLVRIDFLAFRAGDMGRLLVENQVFGMFQGRDKTGHLRNGRDPRGIVQAAPVRGLVLQHAGLPAFYEMFYRNAYAPCGARYSRRQVVPDLSRTGANRLESKQKTN